MPDETEIRMKGLGVAPGVAMGPASVLVEQTASLQPAAAKAEPVLEKERLKKAIEESRSQLESLAGRLKAEGKRKEAEIFEAHMAFLDDETVLKPLEKKIREGRRAEEAVQETLQFFLAALGENSRQASDVRDVGSRILGNLGGGPAVIVRSGSILVAREIAPSTAAGLDPESIGAIVTEKGGKTSHTALLAQAYGLPAVSGIQNLLTHLEDGDILAIDGNAGEIVINPSKETRELFERRLALQKAEREELRSLRSQPARFRDGDEVKLMANIAAPDETRRAFELGAQGIGLYRTEFLFMNRRELPGEEEQYEAYAAVVRAAAGRVVTIRTIDLGGDKLTTLFGRINEANPFLGWRAIRICLDRPDIFRTQMRAILRAANLGPVRAMLPMVATVEEFRHAKSLILEAKAELAARGEKVPEYLPCGMMVEVPSAALMAEHFVPFADFFSIGTNDLTQYALAADRGNDRVAKLYDPMNPGVLRLVEMAIRAAHEGERKIPVCSCGAAAGKPESALIFLGLGVDELSMPGEGLSAMKKCLLDFSLEECRKAARGIVEAHNFETYKQLRGEWSARFKK